MAGKKKNVSKQLTNRVKAGGILIVLIALIGIVPFPYTFTKTTSIPYTTDEQQSAELELNDSKVIQDGVDGKKRAQIKSVQSLWGHIFKLNPMQQKETTSTTLEEPVNKVVIEGTTKYQYMLCSDGGYTFYTDEQFKDPQTGFTNKSVDSCNEHNKGHKLSLTNNKPGTASSSSTNSPSLGSQSTSSETEKINREVQKSQWCSEQDGIISDEYIKKVQHAQQNLEFGSRERYTYLDAAYFKYSNEVKLLRASGCTISNTYPDYTSR